MWFFLFVQTHLDDFNDKAEGERESGEDERDADDDHQVGAHPLTFLACWGSKWWDQGKVRSRWAQGEIEVRSRWEKDDIKVRSRYWWNQGEIKAGSPILSSFSCISPSSCLSFAIVPLGGHLDTWTLGHLEDTWTLGGQGKEKWRLLVKIRTLDLQKVGKSQRQKKTNQGQVN